MTDIIERLRHIIPWCADINDLNAEAADQIERLRAERDECLTDLERLREEFKRFMDICGEGSTRGRAPIDKREWERAVAAILQIRR